MEIGGRGESSLPMTEKRSVHGDCTCSLRSYPADVSDVGIEALLFHCYADGAKCPIANVSKTLTDTHHRYSQIQKEALAVIYGLQKFHQFLYGRNIILVTDHKPLVSLQPKEGKTCSGCQLTC